MIDFWYIDWTLQNDFIILAIHYKILLLYYLSNIRDNLSIIMPLILQYNSITFLSQIIVNGGENNVEEL